MVNQFLKMLHNPQKGWDPINKEYAEDYSNRQYLEFDSVKKIIEDLEVKIGSFTGKKVLDLGGGPGAYSIAFAQKGAVVTWHDISFNYRNIVERKAKAFNVEINYSLGYLEDSQKFTEELFDIVFINLCWFYCLNDKSFSNIVYSLIKPGGYGWINNPEIKDHRLPHQLLFLINKFSGLKFFHPKPPRGRVPKLISQFELNFILVNYVTILSHDYECILFRKKDLKEPEADKDAFTLLTISEKLKTS